MGADEPDKIGEASARRNRLAWPGGSAWPTNLNASSAAFSRTAYFSKPRMYGMTGGRGPVLKSGPRVER